MSVRDSSAPLAAQQLERTSAGTLHHQLYVNLRDLIESGEVKPGERMPTEAEIVAQYAVSRTTVRRALDELRRQGYVDRKPGRGTFVLHQPLKTMNPYLHTVEEEIEQLGYKPGIVPLGVEREAAEPELAETLGVREGDPILLVRRVRTADGLPVYLTEVSLNIARFPALENADFGSKSMYEIFETSTGLRIVRATQWLSATAADREIASALDIAVGDAVLRLERTVFMQGDVPIAALLLHFNGKLYKHYSESYAQHTD